MRNEKSWRQELQVPTLSELCAVTPDPLQDIAMVKFTVTSRAWLEGLGEGCKRESMVPCGKGRPI